MQLNVESASLSLSVVASQTTQAFGQFALVYDIQKLRRLGAVPVIYLPLDSDPKYLSGLANEIAFGFTDADRVINVITSVAEKLKQRGTFGMKCRELDISFDEFESRAVAKFIDAVVHSTASPLNAMLARQKVIASCVYPTENPKYNEALHYYRQREWRIVEGNLVHGERLLFQRSNESQVGQLMEIDADFFGKEILFYDHAKGLGAEVKARIAERCSYYKQLADLDVVGEASFLIQPDDSPLPRAIVEEYERRGVVVRTISQFCNS